MTGCIERPAEDDKTLELVEQLAKEADLAVGSESVADRLRYCQQVMHTAERLVSHQVAVADRIGSSDREGGCAR